MDAADRSAERQLADAARWRAGVDLSSAEFDTVVELYTGYDYETAPARLWAAFQAGDATPAVCAVLLTETWRCKLDHCPLPREAWRTMFAAVPFTIDGQPAARPRRGRRLYRGAVPEHREGLSWTPHFETAAYFAQIRQRPGTVGIVWECRVQPDRVYAHITDEQEYVVDVRGLTIVHRGLVAPSRSLRSLLRDAWNRQ